MALGAERADVLQLVMRESMIGVLAGALLGLPGARPCVRLDFRQVLLNANHQTLDKGVVTFVIP
jgi:hypothetical protein